MMRIRFLALLTVLALGSSALVAACGSSESTGSSEPAGSTSPQTGFVVRLKAAGHHPKVGKPWRIEVTATREGSDQPIQGAAFYEFLFGGAVVSKQYPAPHGGSATKPYRFVGHYSDALTFPGRAVGQPLTFRVVVRAGSLGTRHVDYPVRVVR